MSRKNSKEFELHTFTHSLNATVEDESKKNEISCHVKCDNEKCTEHKNELPKIIPVLKVSSNSGTSKCSSSSEGKTGMKGSREYSSNKASINHRKELHEQNCCDQRGFSNGEGSTLLSPKLGVGLSSPRSRWRHTNHLGQIGGLDLRKMPRPTQQHTFSTDATDVRQMEQGLLKLMDDFQVGNLRAFGKDSRLREMETIREQQENLAKLHFEVGAEQDLHLPLSDEGLRVSAKNMGMLMEKLTKLSESIENLHASHSRKYSATSEATKKYFCPQHSSIQATKGFFPQNAHIPAKSCDPNGHCFTPSHHSNDLKPS